MKKKVRWVVSLSNGETLYEERGSYRTVEGELSPWQRLQAYITEQGLEITSIVLLYQVKLGNDVQDITYHVPSAGRDPKFHAFANATKPIGYNFFRKLGGDVINGDINQDTADVFTVAEAIYENYKLQLWIDDSSGRCWTLIV